MHNTVKLRNTLQCERDVTAYNCELLFHLKVHRACFAYFALPITTTLHQFAACLTNKRETIILDTMHAQRLMSCSKLRQDKNNKLC